jgi:hypothetical protein
MKSRTVYISILFAAASVLAGTIAIAETDQVAALEGGTPAAQPEPGAVQTPEQILAAARATVDGMEATASNVSRMLRSAREKKDAVKTVCLNDKLSQVKVGARAGADRLAVIEAAVSSGSTERLDYEKSVLDALAERNAELAVEANQCIGAEAGGSSTAANGSSELKLRIDPTIPGGNVSTPLGPVLISEPPKAASRTTPD